MKYNNYASGYVFDSSVSDFASWDLDIFSEAAVASFFTSAEVAADFSAFASGVASAFGVSTFGSGAVSTFGDSTFDSGAVSVFGVSSFVSGNDSGRFCKAPITL